MHFKLLSPLSTRKKNCEKTNEKSNNILSLKQNTNHVSAFTANITEYAERETTRFLAHTRKIWCLKHKFSEQSNRCTNTHRHQRQTVCYENKQRRINTNKHAKQLMRMGRGERRGARLRIHCYVKDFSSVKLSRCVCRFFRGILA